MRSFQALGIFWRLDSNRFKYHLDSATNTTFATDYWKTYCFGEFDPNHPSDFSNCDEYFQKYEMRLRQGFPGFKHGNFSSNFRSNWLEDEEIVIDRAAGGTIQFQLNPNISANASLSEEYPNWITADMKSSFTVLLGIFFPSVTGIMAGSNRSGDLKDAQASIPVGTIAAIFTTSTGELQFKPLFICQFAHLIVRNFGCNSLSLMSH